MIFNSIPFFIFIGIFLPLYFFLKGRARLWLSLAASYFFYGWWDYRFLSLIAFSTILDFVLGLQMEKQSDPSKRKILLYLSMMVNLGFLGFFKYFNFFADSFSQVMVTLGMDANWHTLNIILPVGISFYTFQSMSYTIDVYQNKISVEKDLLKFATFIAFFPQLVAGPIVRASEFLPQFHKKIKFDADRLINGSGQVLWGFFKKVAIADSLAPFVDQVFTDPQAFGSMHILIGVVFYSFQIYCDFSGYSDIAIGLARIMGFDFPMNFRTPYFSKNFSEFWTRWHITLSSWLRDYLYIPLGGNRSGSFGSLFFIGFFMFFAVFVTQWWWLIPSFVIIVSIAWYYLKKGERQKAAVYTLANLMVTMLLGGLWHGSSSAFILWGFLHGFYLILQRIFGPLYDSSMKAINMPDWLRVGISILTVYILTCFAWVYFRSPDFETANQVLSGLIDSSTFNLESIINKFVVLKGFILIVVLLTIELSDLRFDFVSKSIIRPIFRIISFAILLWLIALFGTFGNNAFIYFQF